MPVDWGRYLPGIALTSVISTISVLGLYLYQRKKYRECLDEFNYGRVCPNGIPDLIGKTPLVHINSLSSLTSTDIWGKLELSNPGGSSKDRIALQIIRDGEKSGELPPNGTLVEGTSGSTGISLCFLARALGYTAHIVIPDDTAPDKQAMLRTLGAVVQVVKPVSITNAEHYVNVARTLALNNPSALYCDQFETISNFRAHYLNMGPEIWHQLRGNVDVVVSGAGTGGTISGIAAYLKAQKKEVSVVLADPQGSSLYNAVAKGVAYTTEQAERTLRRHRYDTIVEGVGLDRLTANFRTGLPYIDRGHRVSDLETVFMSRFLLYADGIFVGSSSAMTSVAALKEAIACANDKGANKRNKKKSQIVTLLCDSGSRHLARFWNDEVLEKQGLLEAAKAGILAASKYRQGDRWESAFAYLLDLWKSTSP